ncbi:PDZ domain-containing protein [bacterium]|nr:PDZ domain-containing protein [bacterium]
MNKFVEMKKLLLSTILVIAVAINSISLFADTIFLIHGDSIKGIITEQYEDRVIVSVPGGEIGIYRNRISRIRFDEPEQNYLQLGDKYLEKKRFDKAVQLYKRAVKANPNFQQAKDALLKLEDIKKAYIMEKQKKEELLRRIRKESKIMLRKMLGIEIDSAYKMYIYPDSPAAKKGIQTGDKLISIYNQLVKHMSLAKVREYLIGSGTGKVKLTVEVRLIIERHIRTAKSGRLGIRIEIKETGLTITEAVKNSLAERVGLKAGDKIAAINEKSTRYMNMKQVIKNLKQRSAGQLSLTIRRSIVLKRVSVEKTKVSVRAKKKQKVYLGKDISISMLIIPGTERKGLGIKIEKVPEGIKITDVTKGSASDIAGLKGGDIITAIDKKSLKGMNMSDVIKTLKEKKNVEFIITVRK